MKLYTGFLFLILLLFPLIRMTGVEQNFKNFYDSYDISLQYDGIEQEAKEILYERYEATLNKQIEKVLEEQGYAVANVSVKTDAKEEGKVKAVLVTLQKGEEEEVVPTITIAPITADSKEGEEEQEKQTEMEQKEEKEIKELVQTICDQDESIAVEVVQ